MPPSFILRLPSVCVALLVVGCVDLPAQLPEVRFEVGVGDAGHDVEPSADAAVPDAAADARPAGDAAPPMPMPEVCNGLDDDLDDSVDEGVRNACGACGAVPDEACDGFDNDCDLIVDEAESCVCAPGADEVCGSDVGRCTAGVRVCGEAGSWGACSATGPESEVCNGEDDDCDGQTDEGVLNRCGACGALPPDVCNGEDDDCDGVIDGDAQPGSVCPCPLGERRACGTDEGRCRVGVEVCSPQGWGPCDGGESPRAEVCDRVDDDCDGRTDEDACDCPLDMVRACGSDVGACRTGVQRCAVAGWGPCEEAIEPAEERCNGQDDDCDGASDEGWADLGSPCSAGVGACRADGERVCAADGRSTVCSAEEGLPAAREVCNGIDDDCDRRVDELLLGEACDTREPGVCATGAQACVDGAMVCRRGRDPGAETCNGQDDDCDGESDEGWRAENLRIPYAQLAEAHPGCDGVRELIGPDCNAAMHRTCRDMDCHTSGFGPLEQSNGEATVGCVSIADVRLVSFDALSQHILLCNGQAARSGSICGAAIHLWCRGEGFVSGFGPVESMPDAVYVGCVGAPAATFETTYAALEQQHPGCRGAGERDGTDCKAAVHRFCRDRGLWHGYGPVTLGAQAVTVVCIPR